MFVEAGCGSGRYLLVVNNTFFLLNIRALGVVLVLHLERRKYDELGSGFAARTCEPCLEP
ncbi:hypothetical protein NA56DRAFT_317015 [Hyaloscypha hepaticicola]|uniref:Uncharacterized protein n=1 Tax=Hyaloscypha hepaticicola TaxID=2082293 RepID=A0A2J6PQV7_9HELO|nr:hypothetical protein NA56DRAFT_317015 [Hyaloscypha hepaticicola]